MKIIDRIQKGPTLSFEVFPPKSDKPLAPLMETLEKLYTFEPDFISCTYGAMGSNKGRNLEVVSAIQSRQKSEALSHYTCVGNCSLDVDTALGEYEHAGVENLLALRGDFPEGADQTQGEFSHASDLISYIRGKNRPVLHRRCLLS